LKSIFGDLGYWRRYSGPPLSWRNYYIDQVEIGILKGKLMDPIRADKPYQTITIEDIGAFAALAFERPPGVYRSGIGDSRERAY
jgi:hypothetical protein